MDIQEVKISAVIIAFNEEGVIEETLKALDWCDEIVVVDSGSEDRTLIICENYASIIKTRKFNGYGEQKRYAVGLANNDWVLNVDADEIVTCELRDEIQKTLHDNQEEIKGYGIPITLLFMGKVFRYGAESGKRKIRLFNKNFGNFNDNKIHETVELSGRTEKLKNRILHVSYRNFNDYFRKFNSYTSAASLEAYKKNKRVSFVAIILKFPLTFIKIYFLKGALLNGIPGFVWSFISAFYVVVKYLKLYELNSNPPST